MLFPPVHNCDSVEKRRDVNVKDDDGELLARDGRRCFADAYATTSGEKRAARNSELYTDDGAARN